MAACNGLWGLAALALMMMALSGCGNSSNSLSGSCSNAHLPNSGTWQNNANCISGCCTQGCGTQPTTNSPSTTCPNCGPHPGVDSMNKCWSCAGSNGMVYAFYCKGYCCSKQCDLCHAADLVAVKVSTTNATSAKPGHYPRGTFVAMMTSTGKSQELEAPPPSYDELIEGEPMAISSPKMNRNAKEEKLKTEGVSKTKDALIDAKPTKLVTV